VAEERAEEIPRMFTRFIIVIKTAETMSCGRCLRFRMIVLIFMAGLGRGMGFEVMGEGEEEGGVEEGRVEVGVLGMEERGM
jgi:hypothetical protein